MEISASRIEQETSSKTLRQVAGEIEHACAGSYGKGAGIDADAAEGAFFFKTRTFLPDLAAVMAAQAAGPVPMMMKS